MDETYYTLIKHTKKQNREREEALKATLEEKEIPTWTLYMIFLPMVFYYNSSKILKWHIIPEKSEKRKKPHQISREGGFISMQLNQID